MTDTKTKKEALLHMLKSYKRAAVAFSAGVDSTFLLAFAYEALQENVLAVTARGSNFPQFETLAAEAFCKGRNVGFLSVSFDPFAVPGFRNNPPDRCYHCKKALFSVIKAEAASRGFSILLDGTNADDDAGDRPGMKAAEELCVISPLKEAGLTKAEIRLLSREMGLATWDLPAYACLATRFPTGEALTPDKLNAVERAERLLHELGFPNCRVRVHGDIARIALEPTDFAKITVPQTAKTVNHTLKEFGFRFVTLDLGGYRTGDMNQ